MLHVKNTVAKQSILIQVISRRGHPPITSPFVISGDRRSSSGHPPVGCEWTKPDCEVNLANVGVVGSVWIGKVSRFIGKLEGNKGSQELGEKQIPLSASRVSCGRSLEGIKALLSAGLLLSI
jgi:hypothetical protein